MANVPIKIQERITKGITRFRPILKNAHTNNTNESNTVDIVARMLEEVFGYDRFADVTKEYADKKTFCDLAIVKDKKPLIMIEGKKIGLTLNDCHKQQALDYAMKNRVSWALLTNGQVWKLYQVEKDASGELKYEIDMFVINLKKPEELDKLYNLCKESFYKTDCKSLEKYCAEMDLVNEFSLAQILISEPTLDSIRKSIKKLSPETKLTNEQIKERLLKEVVNPNVVDTDNQKVKDATKRVKKALKPTETKPKKEAKVEHIEEVCEH